MVRIVPQGSLKGNWVEKRKQDLEQEDTLHTAAEHDDLVTFRKFLLAGGSLESTSGLYRYTPAHWATYAGSCSVLQEIFEHVSDNGRLAELLLLKDWLWKTPLHTACGSGKLRIVCMFLKLELDGRIPGEVFTAKDIFGKTPMMWAMAQGHADIVEVLILRELYHMLPPMKENGQDDQSNQMARKMILEAQMVAMPRIRALDDHPKELDKVPSPTLDDKEQQPSLDKAKPSLDAPLPQMLDVGLSETLVWTVVKACNDGDYNILLILLRIRDLLHKVACFSTLEAFVQDLIQGLMDVCKTKEQAQTILSPFKDDPTTKTWPETTPRDPVMLALQHGNKQFIAHAHIQALMTDRFDPMGSYEYSSKPATMLFWAVSAVLIYLWWAITFTWLLALRPFSSHLFRFSQKGLTVTDTRYPWHIPYNKWLASYMTLLIMATLLSLLAVGGSPDQPLHPEEIILIVWAISTLIDKALEGMHACLTSGLHLLDLTSSIFYIGYFVARVGYLRQLDKVQTPSFGVMTRASDMLAVSVFCSVLRLLGVFQISPSMGPLLVSVKRILIFDFARFFVILVVVFIAFGLAMVSLFKPLCVNGECNQYDIDWSYSWQNQGLAGAIVHLLFQLFGDGSSQEAWVQKPVTGAIFFIIFTVIVGLLLINLLIAMLSTSYATIFEASEQEYKFIRAIVIRDFGAREAIYPPLNISHLAFGYVGNKLQKVMHSGEQKHAVRLIQASRHDYPFFMWYFPTGEVAEWYLRSRAILFKKFIISKDS